MKRIGSVLIVASFLPWFAAPAIPILPLTIGQKAIAVPSLLILAELLFWGGVLLVGKEVAERYRQTLNPRLVWQRFRQSVRTWFGKG
jgi:hypothetical protein